MDEQQIFDPARYLIQLKGADYLEVKWRLVWLRTEHPDASIETDLVTFTDHEAIVRARVTLPSGGSATGYGSETGGDFRDYLEKAETKAIGRALAALGYGTQFAGDYEAPPESGRIADSPVRREVYAPGGQSQQSQQSQGPGGNGGGVEMSPRQREFMMNLAQALHWTPEQLNDEAQALYNCDALILNRRDASAFIERLKQRVQQQRQ